MKKSMLAFLLLTLSLSALALDEGLFNVRVTSEDDISGTLMQLDGWTCLNYTSVDYQEQLADHHGEQKMFSRSVKGKFSGTEFRKDMHVNSSVNTNIVEDCTRIVKEKKEKDGETVEVEKTEKLVLNWDCAFTNFPQKVGQTISTTCLAAKSDTGISSLSHLMLTELRQRKITADITLKKRNEVYAVDLCKGKNLKERKIIKLTQGLDGLVMENDYVITLEIDGVSKPVKLYKEDGILNDEIVICRKGPIKIKVSAVEEDMMYDDVYSSDKSNTVILNAKSWSENSAKVSFKRDNFWDKMFLDKVQEVQLEIRDAPIQ